MHSPHRGLDDGHEPLVLELSLHHLRAWLVELVVLVPLGVEGVDDVDAGQILARDAVDLIGQLLHKAEARQHARHDDEDQRDYRDDEARRHGRQLPALAENFITAHTAMTGDLIIICSPIATII